MSDKINPYFRTDEIDTTFQQTGDEPSYEGTHTVETPQGTPIAVTREFRTNRERGVLRVLSRFYVDGEEVNRQDQEWNLTDDGEHVEHSGESIEEFCRSNHNADPQIDMEAALEETY